MGAPTEFKLPQHKLDLLLAVTLWYSMMPDNHEFQAGESFHTNVVDFKMSHLPDHPFFATGYCSHFEMRNGVVHAALQTEGATGEDDDYIYVPFVAE